VNWERILSFWLKFPNNEYLESALWQKTFANQKAFNVFKDIIDKILFLNLGRK
jgi:hypothetical protein